MDLQEVMCNLILNGSYAFFIEGFHKNPQITSFKPLLY